MAKLTPTLAVAMAALSLTACGARHEMVNSKICANFKTTPAVAQGDAAAPVDECVRRWAYSLAGTRDSADVVADAAVAACGAALTRWNQGAIGAPAADGDQALSLTTGQPTNPLAEHDSFAHGRALLYAVQARAGRCAPPPAVNGVPAGT